MIKFSFAFIALLTLNIASCSKLTSTTWLYYDETGCADPWRVNSGVSDIEKKI